MYLVTGFLGLVSIIAPYLFGYSDDQTALWTSLVIGAALLIASVFEGMAADRDKREYWVMGIAGAAAILAPFVLGFSATSTALWTLVLIGIATIVVAWVKLFPGQRQYR